MASGGQSTASAATGRARANGGEPAKKAAGKRVQAKKPQITKHYTASLHCSQRALSEHFAEAIHELESALQRPVWMCVQQGDDRMGTLGPPIQNLFLRARAELDAGGPVALVIESPGGYARDAFSIARMLCRHAGGFLAVVPSYAKSAATLLALGAERILMGADAEFGPLDAQLWDTEREERTSALDEVQALERLHSVALEQLDETMMLMMSGAQKRTEVMLPIACRFVSDTMAPLLEKIDTVHYAKQSRVLKVAEDYAERLLLPHHGPKAAADIANQLVNGYPEHGFVIDREEMTQLMGVDLEPPEDAREPIQRLDEILVNEAPFIAIGRLEEVAS